MATQPVVEFQSISKSFGEHKVLSDVTFSAYAGDVIALMGENGAGKSTLMRILAGVYPHGTYAGTLKLSGRTTSFNGVRAAKSSGVAMIHQELGLFPELTVAENLLLEELGKASTCRPIKWDTVFRDAQNYLDQLGFKVDARSKVSHLRTGSCQLVEIARALRSNASVIIMDEPTSALTEPEVLKLFEILKQLQAQDKVIFYVSHRMDEIAKVANRVVVLRDGVIAGVDDVTNLQRDKIIRWMVGRDVANIFPQKRLSETKSAPLLTVKNLTLKHRATAKPIVKGISFNLWPGEILGLGGLMGAGRSEAALALFGYFGSLGPHSDEFEVQAQVFFEGREVQWHSPSQAQSDRVALLTEDRKGTGLLLNRSAAENMTLTVLDQLSNSRRFGAIRRAEEHALIKKLASDLKIRGPGLHAEVGVYSGGNQQKVALSKCLALNPRILILDEPTRGVDIGAKLEIYEIMARLTEQGVSIILISSEMPELLGLSHRVLVLREGNISGDFTGDFDPEKIMHSASL